MNIIKSVPLDSYGILKQATPKNELDEVIESVQNIGYAILDSRLSAADVKHIADEFDLTHKLYVEKHGENRLKSINEINTIRLLLAHGSKVFLKLAFNERLLLTLKKIISGKFILNQQNGVINPPEETYNQGAWHRDLPYQHFVSSTPLAINALFCVDDFTFENGATYVLPASHKSEAFPSSCYIKRHAVQIEAKAGSFILLDCMTFHSGGFNSTGLARRAINHIYNIPYFKQQINIPLNLEKHDLTDQEKEILGFNSNEPISVSDYLAKRKGGY